MLRSGLMSTEATSVWRKYCENNINDELERLSGEIGDSAGLWMNKRSASRQTDVVGTTDQV